MTAVRNLTTRRAWLALWEGGVLHSMHPGAASLADRALRAWVQPDGADVFVTVWRTHRVTSFETGAEVNEDAVDRVASEMLAARVVAALRGADFRVSAFRGGTAGAAWVVRGPGKSSRRSGGGELAEPRADGGAT